MKGSLSFIGWVIFLLLIYAASKTETGYKSIYYSLILILMFQLFRNFEKIQGVMIKKEETTTGGSE